MAGGFEKMNSEQFRAHIASRQARPPDAFLTQPVTPRSVSRPTPAAPPESPVQGTKQATKLLIGLDPGKNTGFAIWQPRRIVADRPYPGQFIEVSTLTFWTAIRRLEKLVREFGAAALHVRIEDVRANKPTFSDKVGNARVRENISQKVGSNKRDCQLLIEFLEDSGIPYTALPPRKRATGKGKVTAEFFKGVKGFPTRSTEHSRDAAALVIDL